MLYTVKYAPGRERQHEFNIGGKVFSIRTHKHRMNLEGDGYVLIPAFLQSRGISHIDWDNPYVKMLCSYNPESEFTGYLYQYGLDIPNMARFAWGLYRLFSEQPEVSPIQYFVPPEEVHLAAIEEPTFEMSFKCTDIGIEINQFCLFDNVPNHYQIFYPRNDENEELFGSPVSFPKSESMIRFGIIGWLARELNFSFGNKSLVKSLRHFDEIYFPQVIDFIDDFQKLDLEKRKKKVLVK